MCVRVSVHVGNAKRGGGEGGQEISSLKSHEHFLNKHPGGKKYTGSEERGAENTKCVAKHASRQITHNPLLRDASDVAAFETSFFFLSWEKKETFSVLSVCGASVILGVSAVCCVVVLLASCEDEWW